jgi:hypothetical protein
MPARRTFAQHYASKRNLSSQHYTPPTQAMQALIDSIRSKPRLGATKPDAASTSPLLTGVKREEA